MSIVEYRGKTSVLQNLIATAYDNIGINNPMCVPTFDGYKIDQMNLYMVINPKQTYPVFRFYNEFIHILIFLNVLVYLMTIFSNY